MRTIFILSLSLLFLSFTIAQKSEIDKEWLILPGEHVGPIHKDTDRKILAQHFGFQEVTDEVQQNKKEALYTSIVFKNQPNELTVIWENAKRTQVKQVNITGYIGSKWRTKEGISVKKEIEDLVTANQGHLVFKKFPIAPNHVPERDIKQSLVTDWQGGRFAKYGSDLKVVLIYNFACEETELNIHKFQGEGTVSSSQADLYTVQLFVQELQIMF